MRDQRPGEAGLAAEPVEEIAEFEMALPFRQPGELGRGGLGCEVRGAARPAAGGVGAPSRGAGGGGVCGIRHLFQAVAKPDRGSARPIPVSRFRVDRHR